MINALSVILQLSKPNYKNYLFIYFGKGKGLTLISVKHNGLQLFLTTAWYLFGGGLRSSPDDVPQIDFNFPLSYYASSGILGSDSPFLFTSLKSLYYPLQPSVLSQLLLFLAWKFGLHFSLLPCSIVPFCLPSR